MSLTAPYWVKQRQVKTESAGDNLYRLTAPNLAEAFVGIRKSGSGLWSSFVRTRADGDDIEATEPVFDTEPEAWYAAFELYRRRIIT
jgi:hypothetical protein